MIIKELNEAIKKVLDESEEKEYKTDKIINKIVKNYYNDKNISDIEDWLNNELDHAIISSDDILDCYKDIVDLDDNAYREIFITVLDYLKSEIREKLNI